VSNQTLRKERAVQTCVLTKEKQIQTTGDHTLSKQVEAKDRRIAELEDALAKSRKKEEKMSKVEKELVDARLKCQRQTKEIGNLESFKKGVEGQRAEIEHLWESNEKLEQNYEVEKNRSAELERRCHDIQNQLHQVTTKFYVMLLKPKACFEKILLKSSYFVDKGFFHSYFLG